MSSAPSQLALFIDADNFRDCDALKQAMQKVFTEGEPVLKHAYGDAVSLKNLEALLAEYGIRPVCNVSVSKNTTDVALAIAAMEAVCRNPAIKTVVICSGDADFAPLAMRLRELGCKMVCYGMEGIVFKAAGRFFDEVEGFKSSDGDTSRLPCALQASSHTPAQPLLPKPVIGVSAANLPSHPSVQQVLQAWPDLRSGQWQPLSQVVGHMRRLGFLGANTKLTRWLPPLQQSFEVQTGTQKPHQIRYLKAGARSVANAPALTRAQLLQAWPDLHDGRWHPLPPVVCALRQRGDLGKNSKIGRWIGPEFELHPGYKPTLIRYRVANAEFATAQNATDKSGKRSPLPVLPEKLHQLRQILLQLAIQRTSDTLVLIAAPCLMAGNWCNYTTVASDLRAQGVLHPSVSLLRVLRNRPERWELAPVEQPQQLRYLGHVRMHKTP